MGTGWQARGDRRDLQSENNSSSRGQLPDFATFDNGHFSPVHTGVEETTDDRGTYLHIAFQDAPAKTAT